MCGIAGIVNLNQAPADRRIVEEMIGVQRHRGPDDCGIYLSGAAALGHARLSIIDLSADAHQPMTNEDSSIFVVHNGEIYNYVELRRELEGRGHRFRSKSDTEVILHAYEEWQEACPRFFNGMWSFAILDLRNKSVFCSRDRFGVKPFYYYLDKDLFLFASEIKSLLCHPAIKAEPNDHAIFGYLASGYGYMDTSDQTFFRNIRQLKPSHCISLSMKNKRFFQGAYWSLSPHAKRGGSGKEEISREFRDLFRDAVRLRLRSDVPLGISLSGGLDSSSIACMAAELVDGGRIETFSSCFDDEEYDERRYIKPVLDRTGARPNFVFVKPGGLFDDIEDILWHQEEPYSTLSIFPQWHVMKLARGKGVKVLLTGQGGDEVLGGYGKYYFYLFADLFYSMKWIKAFKEIGFYRKLNADAAGLFAAATKIILSYITPDMLKRAIRPNASSAHLSCLNKDFAAANLNRISTQRRFGSILNNALYNDMKISPLPSLLHIDDRSSMAHSVESRAPFLDYRVVEYLFSLGPEYKIRDGVTKYLLRESMKGLLPEVVRNRKDKMGFVTPLEKWFKTELKDEVYRIIDSREFSSRPYFDKSRVLKKFKDFVEGKAGVSPYTVWSWVNLELWFRRFMDAKHGSPARRKVAYEIQ